MSFKLAFSRPVLEGKTFNVTHDRAEHPSGVAIDREVVKNSPSAVILPRRDGHVLLIRQYRLPMRKQLWEIPAGRCDPGEPPLDAAQRELQEETGYRAGRLDLLRAFYLSPGILDERMHLFLATDLTAGEAAREEGEEIDNLVTPWDDAVRMVYDGAIEDAKTIAGLLYYDRLRGQAANT